MSYDGALSQMTGDKLNLYPREEDIRSIEEPARTVRSESSTPSRKISSSRFMNAFSQFYTNNVEDDNSPSSSAGRTPTKGMETKLLSMWHNVKYGWNGKIRSNFSKEQPVWLLGRCYHRKFTPSSSMESSTELTTNMEGKISMGEEFPLDNSFPAQELAMDASENQSLENPWEEDIEGFKRDFISRIWMTYRREFPILNGSHYTSDCGWGCMLRSGQMLLAQALIYHFLGRSWRWDANTQIHATYDDNIHRKIIKWFGDSSSRNSPFSIHTLVNLGQEMGKKAGDWYGPASVSVLLRQAMKNAAKENVDLDNINIYVAKDCTVYIQDILDECCIYDRCPKELDVPWQNYRKQTAGCSTQAENASQMHIKSVIILIPLRLGADKLNAVYAHCLKQLLSTEYCIGIIGGRPKHSLYFVGFQEDKLIHLDPHYCQEMVDVNQDNFPINSFHCKSPRKLKVSKMDPSCCIGFYCQTKTDFDNFIASVQMYLHPIRYTQNTDKTNPESSSVNDAEVNYPMFTFSRGRCSDHQKDGPMESVYKPLQKQLNQLRQELDTMEDDDDETEEFVLL